MRNSRLVLMCLWSIAAIASPQPSKAAALAGLRTLSLVSPSGEKTVIGHVRLTAKDDGYAFEVTYDRGAFKEVYMEETNFLCLPGEQKDICQFPYPPGDYAPNDSTGFFKEQDLQPLEFALLFAERRTAEVDINPFNGIYYRLHVAQNHIEGILYAADFHHLIGAEHDAKFPLDYGDLDSVDAKGQRYPQIIID